MQEKSVEIVGSREAITLISPVPYGLGSIAKKFFLFSECVNNTITLPTCMLLLGCNITKVRYALNSVMNIEP
jgi:hypothetical protein